MILTGQRRPDLIRLRFSTKRDACRAASRNRRPTTPTTSGQPPGRAVNCSTMNTTISPLHRLLTRRPLLLSSRPRRTPTRNMLDGKLPRPVERVRTSRDMFRTLSQLETRTLPSVAASRPVLPPERDPFRLNSRTAVRRRCSKPLRLLRMTGRPRRSPFGTRRDTSTALAITSLIRRRRSRTTRRPHHLPIGETARAWRRDRDDLEGLLRHPRNSEPDHICILPRILPGLKHGCTGHDSTTRDSSDLSSPH